jgi:hypothetical protein
MNYPYQGKADGFTTTLRRQWPGDSYVGIEIEVNQKWPLGDRRTWRRLVSDLSISIASAVGEPSARKVHSR